MSVDFSFRPKPDGRTTESRIAKAFREELLAKLPGPPDDIQMLIVDEAVRLRCRLLRDTGGEALDRLIKMRQLLGIPA